MHIIPGIKAVCKGNGNYQIKYFNRLLSCQLIAVGLLSGQSAFMIAKYVSKILISKSNFQTYYGDENVKFTLFVK